jgi:hypothetical protein
MWADNDVWWPFWKWRPVKIFQCQKSIRDIIIYPHIKLWWYRTMLIFCDIVPIPRNCSMSGHHLGNIFTGRHFQNGHHNIANIQHCPISSQFGMWVDNDVPNWFLTLKNFYRSLFSKWPPQYRATGKNFSMSEINSGHYSLPTYEMALTSDNVEFEWYCGGHFENGDW